MTTRRFVLLCTPLVGALLAGCSDSRAREARGANQSMSAVVTGKVDNAACDGSLWQHVYKPSRLSVVDQCKTVTGVLQDIQPDDDGDMHAVLIPDDGQQGLVNKRNQKKKGGGVVIEIVCSVQPKSPKSAIKACAGYHAGIAMPSAGSHVRVTGSYVVDSHNGWTEIHPVSRIEVVR